MSVDADTYFEVDPEFIVQPQQFMEFKKERNACIVGADIAATYGFKVGDIINITGDIYPGDWPVVARPIYQPRDKTVDGTQMLFHWTYLDERMKAETPGRAGQVGWYVVKISDPDQAAAISQQIDALFANSRAETKTETERAFQQGFLSATGTIITAMNFISFVIIGIIMLVLGNTMIMSARERTREYAVLKTLGFSGGSLVSLIAGESLIISVLGAVIGLLLTLPLVEMFSLFVPKSWFPVFYVEPITY